MKIQIWTCLGILLLAVTSCGDKEEALEEEQVFKVTNLMRSLDSVTEVGGQVWYKKGSGPADYSPNANKKAMYDKMSECQSIYFNPVDLTKTIPTDAAQLSIEGGLACPVQLNRVISYQPGKNRIQVEYTYDVGDPDFIEVNSVNKVNMKGSLALQNNKLTGLVGGEITSSDAGEVLLQVSYDMKGRHTSRDGEIEIFMRFPGERGFEVNATVEMKRKKSGSMSYKIYLNGEKISLSEFNTIFGWSLGLARPTPELRVGG